MYETIYDKGPNSHEESANMSIKFFKSQRALFMFDPETYKIFIHQEGKWLESNDPDCHEEVRFHTVELSMSTILESMVLNR
jgi:hypothetical protein